MASISEWAKAAEHPQPAALCGPAKVNTGLFLPAAAQSARTIPGSARLLAGAPGTARCSPLKANRGQCPGPPRGHRGAAAGSAQGSGAAAQGSAPRLSPGRCPSQGPWAARRPRHCGSTRLPPDELCSARRAGRARCRRRFHTHDRGAANTCLVLGNVRQNVEWFLLKPGLGPLRRRWAEGGRFRFRSCLQES